MWRNLIRFITCRFGKLDCGFILLCMFLLAVLTVSYVHEPRFRVSGYSISPLMMRCNPGLTSLKDVVSLSEDILNSYRKRIWGIVQVVDPTYADSFQFTRVPGAQIRYLVSQSDEAALVISPAESTSFEAVCLKLPVQATLFGGIEAESTSTSLTVSPQEYDSIYKNIEHSAIVLPRDNQHIYIENGNFVGPHPKVFQFGDDSSWAVASNIHTGLRLQDSIRFSMWIRGWLLISGARSLGWVKPSGLSIGRVLAESEIQSFAVKSLFFRRALAIPALATLAREISSKEQDQSTPYSYTAFLHDLDSLYRIAAQHGVEDTVFVRAVLDYESGRLYSGVLFWHYASDGGFVLQFAVGSVLFTIVVFLLLKFAIAIPRLLKERKVLSSGALLALNWWMFSQHPPFLPPKTQILLVLITTVCLYVLAKSPSQRHEQLEEFKGTSNHV